MYEKIGKLQKEQIRITQELAILKNEQNHLHQKLNKINNIGYCDIKNNSVDNEIFTLLSIKELKKIINEKFQQKIDKILILNTQYFKEIIFINKISINF